MEESDHEEIELVERNVAAATIEESPPVTRHSNTERNYDVVAGKQDALEERIHSVSLAEYGDENQRGGATIVSARTGMNRVLLAADGSSTRNATYSYANRPVGGGGPATHGRIIRVRVRSRLHLHAQNCSHLFLESDNRMTNCISKM